ncbi:MAG: hypothetical protein DMF08_05710 [Verrucomicrobia bacterium]|nr:MAG: hypothetical protein DMF08_05710 [Verrucomicrobiota bacterium]
MNSAENKTVAPGEFVTTRWSLIFSGAGLGSGDLEMRQALAELCQIYWRPIFLFIARRGYSREDAEDLTQDFFVRILKADWLQKADPARGRFRSLLLKSLQNFLKARRRRPLHFVGFLDSRDASTVEPYRRSTEILASRTSFRCELGRDDGTARTSRPL